MQVALPNLLSPPEHAGEDVFSRISGVLVKEILDLRETLDFYELYFLEIRSAERFDPCPSPGEFLTCPAGQMQFDFAATFD